MFEVERCEKNKLSTYIAPELWFWNIIAFFYFLDGIVYLGSDIDFDYMVDTN